MKTKAKNKLRQGLSYVLIFMLGMLTVIGAYSFIGALQPTQVVQVPAPAPAASPSTSQPTNWQVIEKSAPIVAVNQAETQGSVGSVTVQLIPGRGNVLVETSPLSMPDLQDSANTAVLVAQTISRTKTTNNDFVFIYNMDADVVGGGSGGAAETLAVLATLQNKNINPHVAISGTINPDGTIGPVGGLAEKAQAVAAAGFNTFLVPEGQSIVTEYQQVVQKQMVGSHVYYNTQVVPKTVDLEAANPGLKVIEVSNIKDAIKYMLQ